MKNLLSMLSLAILSFSAVQSVAQTNPQFYGCYFTQGRESGEWVTSTAALFIEEVEDGILLHGSVSSWKNSWISTPDNQSPVLLKKAAARKYRYQAPLDSTTGRGRCELVLHYDRETIYINKYSSGCKHDWNTGDDIGPSAMSFASKQPSSDMCLSYLGISEKNVRQAPSAAQSTAGDTNEQ